MNLQYDARDCVVDLKRISKEYRDHTAVSDVSIAVTAGEIVGLVGPNGAGKTTILEIAEGLLSPTSGRVALLGTSPEAFHLQNRGALGVAFQRFALPRHLTIAGFARLLDALNADAGGLRRWIDALRLTKGPESRVAELSLGQQQKLCIAAALHGDRKAVLLDEPSSALDPQARLTLWSLLKERAAAGLAILMSTQSMDEAATICDRIYLLAKGVVVDSGKPAELIARRFPPAVLVVAAPGEDEVRKLLGTFLDTGRVALHRCSPYLLVSSPDREGALLGECASAIAAARGTCQIRPPNLQDVYLHVASEGTREAA